MSWLGFHAHVQDVAGGQAGTLLALSNTGGIVMGICGNLATGWLVARTGSFSVIFAFTAALYCSSFVVWSLLVRGGPLFDEEPAAA